jgi:uncharacterized protein (TIGR02996 family)
VTLGLSELLADWRDERTESLAEAIDARTAELLADLTIPEPIHDRELHRMCIDAAKDVVRRGWATAMLRERLPGNQPSHRLDALAKRIEALIAQGPDPRTSHAVASAIAADPSVLAYRRVFDAAIVALGDSGDRRSAQMLAAVSRVAPTAVDPLQHAIQTYLRSRKPAPALDPKEYAARVETTPEIEELWRQLVANPGDDTTRAVLGDALLANGDPRGELFALQLTAGADPPRRARIDALIARFGERWIGPLKTVASRVVFERGAVAAVALRPDASPAWDELARDRVLATIEVVIPNMGLDDDYLRLIASPAMASLHSLEVHSARIAAAIHRLSAPIRHVALGFLARERAALRECLSACTARSSIRSAAIYPSSYDTLARTGWLDHLTALTIGGPMRDAIAIWPRLPRAIDLTVRSRAALVLSPGLFDQLVLRRDGASTVARALGSWLLQPLDPLLGSIANLARVEIAGDEQLANRIRGELRGVEVVEIEPPDLGHGYQVR